MEKPITSKDVLESLTPREAEVLRKRFGDFGRDDDVPSDTSVTNSGQDDSGSGGTPAPATLPE